MGRLNGIDRRIFSATLRFSSESGLNKSMRFISRSGNKGVVWLCVSALLLANPRYRVLSGLCVLAVALTAALSEGLLKHIFRRPRPFVTHNVTLTIPLPSGFSFPSGHTASSMAAAQILSLAGLWLAVPVYAYAALMGYARIYLKAHYASDVVIGGAIGLFCGEMIRKMLFHGLLL